MLNFPSNPQDRQIYPYPPQPGVNTFVYNEERGIWNRIPVAAPGNNLPVSANSREFMLASSAPTTRPDTSALQDGDQWFNTSNSQLNVYYSEAPGDHWVAIVGA